MPIKKKRISPRQKMINLMYVVLMAMLALNVSSDAVRTIYIRLIILWRGDILATLLPPAISCFLIRYCGLRPRLSGPRVGDPLFQL